MSNVGFVGGGRVTRILLGGWQRAGAMPKQVLIHDPSDDAFAAVSAMASDIRRATVEEAATADVVFLALHPPAIGPVLPLIRPRLSTHAVIVSLAPKVTAEVISFATGSSRIARMIPNAPSILGEGFNPVAYSTGLDAATRSQLAALFAPWGRSPEVQETQLEAYAILTGMGPTYLWFQLQALREIAGEMGLDATACDTALRAMVTGSLATLLDGGLSPAAVMDLVPVKPLGPKEPEILAAYRDALPALFAKIRSIPAPAR